MTTHLPSDSELLASAKTLLQNIPHLEQQKNYQGARSALGRAVGLLRLGHSKEGCFAHADQPWFEKLINWSNELKERDVAFIYLLLWQNYLNHHWDGQAKEANIMNINHLLLRFANGMEKWWGAEGRYQTLIAYIKSMIKKNQGRNNHIQLLWETTSHFLELTIKKQQWHRAKQLLDDFEKIMEQYNIKGQEAITRHEKLASFYYLGVGDYDKAFVYYEHRYKKNFDKFFTPKDHHLPENQWHGEDIKNQTLLVATEQGLGDTFMFCRFLPLLSGLAKKFILQTQPSTQPLLESSPCCQNLPDLEIITNKDVPPFHDKWVMLQSLPLMLGKLLGRDSLEQCYHRQTPYLSSPKGEIAIPNNGKKKIGLVWQTNHRRPDWQVRSFTLHDLLPILSLDYDFFSFQLGDGLGEVEAMDLHPIIHDLAPSLQHFGHTAQWLQHMDWVITADTALSHVTGGLMNKTIVLLPKNNDWRWGLKDASYWYPQSHYLLRQEKEGDWSVPIKKARQLLTSL